MIKARAHDGKGSKSKSDIKTRGRLPNGAVKSSARFYFQVLSEPSSQEHEKKTRMLNSERTKSLTQIASVSFITYK